jgi:fumarate hydratase subunit alpha
MREIPVENITRAVRDLSIQANTDLGTDVLDAFHRSLETETSPVGKEILERLIENAAIAHQEKIPICQDTGMAVVFVEMGQDVHVVGGDLKEAIHEGVRQGYRDGYLRKSVCLPLSRQNTGDNTPAIIHFDVVAGDSFKIILAPKGFGSENMSRVTMLTPAEGIEGIKNYVVGPDPELAALEKDWLLEINRLGIGPQGLGGRTTALGVHIIAAPCHIASISLAVNIQCHASRHKKIEL